MREHSVPAPIYHPWRVLGRHWPHVIVEHTDDLPPGRRADTNGTDEIRIRRRLLQVERRCSLTHELIHLEHQHSGPCTAVTEAAVDREAARRLIPWERLLAAVRWARSETELADELWVTGRILRARISELRADELMEIARAAHDAHHTMPPEEHPMTDQPHPSQPQLALELSEPASVPWWAEIVEHETEGDQDTGWWGA